MTAVEPAGTFWKAEDTTRITLPITPASPTAVCRGSQGGKGAGQVRRPGQTGGLCEAAELGIEHFSLGQSSHYAKASLFYGAVIGSGASTDSPTVQLRESAGPIAC